MDESGDHSLKSVDPAFPLFCLSFCIFDKRVLAEQIVPEFQKFKFDYWGHDLAVLHEHEIRKSKNDFKFLMKSAVLREQFYSDLNALISSADFSIISCVINKDDLKAAYDVPWSPYEIALRFCLERLHDFMVTKGQQNRTLHIVFECRGNKEDAGLKVEFDNICSNSEVWGYRRTDFSKFKFLAEFAHKQTNLIGLQFADLTARPIALRSHRPKQSNRAFELIENKIWRNKVFPGKK